MMRNSGNYTCSRVDGKHSCVPAHASSAGTYIDPNARQIPLPARSHSAELDALELDALLRADTEAGLAEQANAPVWIEAEVDDAAEHVPSSSAFPGCIAWGICSLFAWFTSCLLSCVKGGDVEAGERTHTHACEDWAFESVETTSMPPAVAAALGECEAGMEGVVPGRAALLPLFPALSDVLRSTLPEAAATALATSAADCSAASTARAGELVDSVIADVLIKHLMDEKAETAATAAVAKGGAASGGSSSSSISISTVESISAAAAAEGGAASGGGSSSNVGLISELFRVLDINLDPDNLTCVALSAEECSAVDGKVQALQTQMDAEFSAALAGMGANWADERTKFQAWLFNIKRGHHTFTAAAEAEDSVNMITLLLCLSFAPAEGMPWENASMRTLAVFLRFVLQILEEHFDMKITFLIIDGVTRVEHSRKMIVDTKFDPLPEAMLDIAQKIYNGVAEIVNIDISKAVICALSSDWACAKSGFEASARTEFGPWTGFCTHSFASGLFGFGSAISLRHPSYWHTLPKEVRAWFTNLILCLLGVAAGGGRSSAAEKTAEGGGGVSAAAPASAAGAVDGEGDEDAAEGPWLSWASQPMITPIRSLMISRVFPELCARDLLELDAEKIQVRQTS